jgi:hypothetical protein
MKRCPRCDGDIGELAIACRCGWKERGNYSKKDEPAIFMQCAHMGCNTSAICRVKTKTGLADFCILHYEQFYTDKASATCERLGLRTTKQKRELVRKTVKELSRNFTPDYNRQPGQDWDEPIA